VFYLKISIRSSHGDARQGKLFGLLEMLKREGASKFAKKCIALSKLGFGISPSLLAEELKVREP
jgi:hypothetical protein